MAAIEIDGVTLDIQANLDALDKADCEESLVEFIKRAWEVLEPGQPYIHNWHVDALAYHLEAITDGVQLEDDSYYNRLLINIPPGFSKSMVVSVLWPAWEWGPKNKPYLRYVCASHSQDLAIRDNVKMRRLVMSDWYQRLWGDRVVLTGDQNMKTKFENTHGGFRQAAAAGSITGSRGDRVIIDDPNSVESAASEQQRASTNEWFLEAVPTRLNNPIKSAIVVIMQRLHEEDVSGIILDKNLGYDHLCLPMRFEAWRKDYPTRLGFVDPREEEGELLFPERFPIEVVDRDEKTMGPYAAAGQFQQTPVPRGGGIIQREWWQTWDYGSFPDMSFIIASLDTAYTEKQENDPSAMTVWGVFHEEISGQGMTGVRVNSVKAPKLMLMSAWEARLPLHELVKKVSETCSKMQVDVLLIENKAAGHSVAQEIRRLYQNADFGVQMYDPKNMDKQSRLYSVQHIFAEGMVYAPNRIWADAVINQTSSFPKGKHDDLVDTLSMAVRYLRDRGFLVRGEERIADVESEMRYDSQRNPPPLYY